MRADRETRTPDGTLGLGRTIVTIVAPYKLDASSTTEESNWP